MLKLTINEIKIIALSSIGGALEFFEFTIYALFSQYIGMHFFPNKTAFSVLIATFGVYAVGYLARPLGGLFFGHFGDKYGRKNAFTLTILLMAVATLLIGCVPSYQVIGISAPIILVILRLLQGFSVGGEISGAIVFTAEHLPLKHRGLGIGIVFMGITVGNVLGGATGFILNNLLGNAVMMAWGWRIPFLLAFLLGIFSYFIRKKMAETPIFQQIQKNNTLQKIPFLILCKTARKKLIISILLMANSSTIIAFFLFMPVYLSVFLKFKMQQTFLLNTISFLILSILTAVFGYLSDLINRVYLALMGCLMTALVSYFAFQFFLEPNSSSIYIFVILIAVAGSIVNGCYALLIAEIFPASIRYSGIGVSYSMGVAIFGGLGPLIFTFLIQQSHNLKAPYYYLLFSAFLTAIGLFSLLKTSLSSLAEMEATF